MRPLLVAAGAWPSAPPRHVATCVVEAQTSTSDGRETTTRWTGGSDGVIVRWEKDLSENKSNASDEPNIPVAFYGGHTGPIVGLIVNEVDNLLISSDTEGVVYAWAIGTNVSVACHEVPIECEIKGLAMENRNVVLECVDSNSKAMKSVLDPRTLNVLTVVNSDTINPLVPLNKKEKDIEESASALSMFGWDRRGGNTTNNIDDCDSRLRGTQPGADPVKLTHVETKWGSFDSVKAMTDAWPVKGLSRDETHASATCSVLLRGQGDFPSTLAVGLNDGCVVFQPLCVNSLDVQWRGADEPYTSADAPSSSNMVTAMAEVNGTLLVGDARGVVRVFDCSKVSSVDVATPTLVHTLVHHACAVETIEELDVYGRSVSKENNSTEPDSVIVTVDRAGVVGIVSVTRDETGNVPCVRNEMLFPPAKQGAHTARSTHLVWDCAHGILTVFRKGNGNGKYDATAWDVIGGALERSLAGREAVALFTSAKKAEGAVYCRVGVSSSWKVHATSKCGVDELSAGDVARVMSLDVVALLDVNVDDTNKDSHLKFLRNTGAALYVWGSDSDCDEAACDVFLESVPADTYRSGSAALGAGGAISVATLCGQFNTIKIGSHSLDATRAVATAAFAARVVELTETVPGSSTHVVSDTLLTNASMRLSKATQFTQLEHLAALVKLFQSPCIFIQNAARSLFHANTIKAFVLGNAHEVPPQALDDAARAAVYSAEQAGETRHRESVETFLENASVAAGPVIVAAATQLALADENMEHETSSKSATACALIHLLSAPSALLVADAASLLAEGVARDEWAKSLSSTELAKALDCAFTLAELLAAVGGWRVEAESHATSPSATQGETNEKGIKIKRKTVLGSPIEQMTARDAVGDLLSAFAASTTKVFCQRFELRLNEHTAFGSQTAHLVMFLALSRVARERVESLDPYLDSIAQVMCTAINPSTPNLRKACHAGASALAFELSLNSRRVAYFRDRGKQVERIAVAVDGAGSNIGSAGSYSPNDCNAVLIYDLTAGAKTKVLRESMNDEVSAAADSMLQKDTIGAINSAASKLSSLSTSSLNAFSQSLGLTPTQTWSGTTETPVSKTVPRVRVSIDGYTDGTRQKNSPVRRSVDIIPTPQAGDVDQEYAAAAAAAAMALAANSPGGSRRRSPFTSPRVSASFKTPFSVAEDRNVTPSFDKRADTTTTAAPTSLKPFALAFDKDGSRLAGYRDDGSNSKVRVWHLRSSVNAFGFSGLGSLGARLTGSGAQTVTILGCVDSFIVGEAIDLVDGDTGGKTSTGSSVSLTWESGKTVVLKRGEVVAAFGVRE